MIATSTGRSSSNCSRFLLSKSNFAVTVVDSGRRALQFLGLDEHKSSSIGFDLKVLKDEWRETSSTILARLQSENLHHLCLQDHCWVSRLRGSLISRLRGLRKSQISVLH
ncbi:hypothetical protein F2P56_005686 [Juglans regia]|uniref:Uncharacterized protein n=2 Tax=Juglans regia TaxID=51240 RepID=A0A834D2R9_JUGRE|nr:uncharacterized protein LOC109005707 [Juglans regia]KAF5473718.1 hypothetical protein F2P56_005686 [Juglans regia]